MMQRARGFSLIELMIVLAIVAILATIAVPSYRQYVVKAQRKEAMAALQGLAQAMERRYAEKSTYADAASGEVATGAPAIYPTTSPVDGGKATYSLSIVSPTSSSFYALRATPIGGTSQANDGVIELDSTGARRWDRNNNGIITDTNENNWNDH